MALYHAYSEVENSNTGVPMVGVRVVPVFPNTGDGGSGVAAPIYADESSTPFVPANYCVTDESGMYSFYIDPGSYNLDFFIGSRFIRRISDVQYINPIPTSVEEPYRATLSEAINEFPIGFYFRSDDKNAEGPYPDEMWIYQRIGLEPYYIALVSNTASVAELNAAIEAASLEADRSEAAAQNALNYGNAAIRSGYVAADAETWTAGAWVQITSNDTGTHASKAGDFGASGGQTPNSGVFQEDASLGLVRKAATVDVLAAQSAGDAQAAAGQAQSYADSIVGYIVQRDGDSLIFVNEDDQSVMARLNMATGLNSLISVLVRDFLESPVYRLPSGASLADTQADALRLTDGSAASWMDLGLDAQKFASTTHREANIRKAYLRSSFTGPDDRIVAAQSAQVNLVIWFGQSWSMGFDAVPVANGQSNYPQVLTFNGGVRQQQTVAQNPAALQSFITGVETQATGTAEIPTAVVGETGAISFGNRLIELLRDENNFGPSNDYRLLVAAPGEGSKDIEVLIDPAGVYMARIQSIINQAFAICQANGWTLAVPAVCWLQGQGVSDEAGIPGDQAGEYPQEMENGRLLVQSYVAALMPGHPPVKWITWQVQPQANLITAQGSAKTVYERFVSGIAGFPHIICSGPAYQYPNIASGNVHIDAWGMADIGQTMAVAFKRAVIDGVDVGPLKPASIMRQGRIAVLETNLARRSLAIDTIQAAEAANYGFSLYDSGGTPITINSVSVSANRVQIVAASAIPAGAQLGYADVGTNYARTTKWRGNIRDDAGKNLAGQNNWLVAFRLPFNN